MLSSESRPLTIYSTGSRVDAADLCQGGCDGYGDQGYQDPLRFVNLYLARIQESGHSFQLTPHRIVAGPPGKDEEEIIHE